MLIFDGSQINLLIAFIGGVVTFFASCLLPLVPTYLAYLSGIATTKDIGEAHKKIYKREVFINGTIFTIGFIFVFVLLGATANTVGRIIGVYRPVMQKIGGFVFIGLGLFMLGIFKRSFLYKEKRLKLPKDFTKFKKVNSLLIGITFGFAWTPCIGPVLAVILFWASQAQTFVQGIGLLFVYGIGLGIPFLIVALLFEKLTPKLSKTAKFGNIVQKIAAVIIIVMGILLFIGKINLVSIKLLQLLNLNTLAL